MPVLPQVGLVNPVLASPPVLSNPALAGGPNALQELKKKEKGLEKQCQEAKGTFNHELHQGTVIDLDPDPQPEDTPDDAEGEQEETPDSQSVEPLCLSPSPVPSPCPGQGLVAAPHKPPAHCYWSLELLIAAAFCTDVPPFPMLPCSARPACGSRSQPAPHHGMELLSELADLEIGRASCRERVSSPV